MAIPVIPDTPDQAVDCKYRLLDPKFRENSRQYIYQCVLATVSIFVVLTVLDAVTQTVLVASLGASSFIAFTMPHVEAARPRYLVGGYLMGTLVGCSVSTLGAVLFAAGLVESGVFAILFGALATGLAIFLMVVTDTEHPPAAALALGFTFANWDVLTVVVVLTGIVSIACIKEGSKSRMINLL